MTRTRQVPAQVVHRVVDAATMAPSVHNTQPWRWYDDGRALELWADRSRALPVTDPDGRNLTVSCGAALHHARVAAAALGWATATDLLPDPGSPDLLARLVLSPAAPSPHAEESLDLLVRRRTDRRRFTSWPVPDERLAHLAATATAEGARATALTDVTERFRAERLVLLAGELQRADADARAEQEAWLDHSDVDGIPRRTIPEPSERPGGHPHRFGNAPLHLVREPVVGPADGLVVLFDDRDEPRAWLRAGEGLSALWLAATRDGLSVVPISQVVEVPETRRLLGHDVLGGLAAPVVVVRIGWQAMGRELLEPTPRRPMADVLEQR